MDLHFGIFNFQYSLERQVFLRTLPSSSILTLVARCKKRCQKPKRNSGVRGQITCGLSMQAENTPGAVPAVPPASRTSPSGVFRNDRSYILLSGIWEFP